MSLNSYARPNMFFACMSPPFERYGTVSVVEIFLSVIVRLYKERR